MPIFYDQHPKDDFFIPLFRQNLFTPLYMGCSDTIWVLFLSSNFNRIQQVINKPFFIVCVCLFQAHLLNLFDNVNRVVFHEKNYDQILSFQSQEGETVDLSQSINAQVQYF